MKNKMLKVEKGYWTHASERRKKKKSATGDELNIGVKEIYQTESRGTEKR